MGWELLRWAGIQTYDRLGPGASVRRLHRLRRLRDTTARAIEDELRRRVDQQASSETSTAQPKRRPVEGRLSGPPRRSCTEGGSSSSSAVATLGSTIAGGELGPKLERSQGFSYLPPPPVKEVHIEQVVHGGPYYVTDPGSHLRAVLGTAQCEAKSEVPLQVL